MDYREWINKYREGTLSEEEKKQLEEELEKQRVLRELLDEEERIPGLDDEPEEAAPEADGLADKSNEDELSRKLRRSVRKMLSREGLKIGAVLLAIMLFLIYVLPQIVDLFYYDPSENAVYVGDGYWIDRLSLDAQIYSELFLPGKGFRSASAEGRGNGEYDIVIYDNTPITTDARDVAGKITRDKLLLYDPNVMDGYPANIFSFLPPELDWHYGTGWDYLESGYDPLEEARKTAENLQDIGSHVIFVTFDHVMSYEEFRNWSIENKVSPRWCAAAVKNEPYDDIEYCPIEPIVGFDCMGVFRFDIPDAAKYPYLYSWEDLKEAHLDPETGDYLDISIPVSEEAAVRHLAGMLRYESENPEFIEMLTSWVVTEDYDRQASRIEEEGIYTYGCMLSEHKDEILRICDMEGVADIEFEFIYH